MNKIRKWLFAKLWILTITVAPVEVRVVVQKSLDIGLTQMEEERSNG